MAGVLALIVGLGACTGGGTPPPPPPAPPAGEPRPVLSYTPTPSCASCDDGCLSGTEVQALESFAGRLYAGTTNWEETLACVWPATSAQVNVLSSPDGTWQRTPDLPGSGRCAPGVAPWEQVDDLHAAAFAGEEYLLAGVLANEDGACPGLHAGVFALDATGQAWVDTGLGARLEQLYGPVNSEVRYVETFSDGTGDCPADRPCVFAFVGPRSGAIGPSAWRGVYAPGTAGCALICWDAEPEVVMDGVDAPLAARIVSSASGPAGLHFGTTAVGPRRCRAGADLGCNQAALMHRVAPGDWEPVWLGPPVADGGPDQVRGIASWGYGDDGGDGGDGGDRVSLWFVTGSAGTVYRIDAAVATATATVSPSDPVAEVTLGDLLPAACNSRMLPYQLYVHQRGPDDTDPELLVASQGCGTTPQDSFARIFRRPVAPDGTWSVVAMPTITNVGADRSNEAAVRCIETSPFAGGDVFFGTTDMNSTPGSLTARIYRLTLPPADP